jgi:YD repeat-containing protein
MQNGFKLDYDTDMQKQRAWLTKCTQLPNMATSENGPVYEFTYYNKDLLPARLHHSQDFWGYFNQNQYSLSLAPNIPNGLFVNECAIPGDKVDSRPLINRNSDEELMKYGSLKRIKYPTGGYSEFEFEPHRFTNFYYTYYNINDEQIGAGLRVAQITNLSDDEKFISQKKFEYLDGLIMSIPMPFFQSIASCGGSAVQMFNSSSSSLMQASPTASGSLVGYGKVIEYNLDENKHDNGKIERTFYNVQEEKPWEIVLGRRWTPSTPTQAFNWLTTGLFFPVGTPYNNENGTRNGSILTEEYFRNRDNHYEINKKILYEYDTIGLGRVQGHIFAFPSCNTNTHWNCLEMVYIRYYTNTLYNRLINKKTFNYSIGKVNEYLDMPLINEDNYLFSTASFHLMAGTEKISGDMNLKTSFEYLPSLTAPQTPNDHYRLGIISNTSNYRNNLLLDRLELNFNNDLLPIQMRKRIVTNSHQLLAATNDDVTNFTYHDNAHMKMAETSDQQKTSFIWDPVYEKITALILNATENDFVYTGFDNNVKHRISYQNFGLMNTPEAKTGSGVYNLNYSPIGFDLNPGKYRINFWYKQNIGSINITVSAGNLLSIDIGTEDASGWKMYTALIEVNSSSSITISGNCLMDELKVYPVEASLKTFTYSQNGMISNSNEANEVSTFKYDAFGRLTLIGDNEGQVKTQVISRIKQ